MSNQTLRRLFPQLIVIHRCQRKVTAVPTRASFSLCLHETSWGQERYMMNNMICSWVCVCLFWSSFPNQFLNNFSSLFPQTGFSLTYVAHQSLVCISALANPLILLNPEVHNRRAESEASGIYTLGPTSQQLLHLRTHRKTKFYVMFLFLLSPKTVLCAKVKATFVCLK